MTETNSPRRRPAPDGLLLIDKPSGQTSHDVVAKVRRVDRKARVGHTGTLDPLATGLLVICVGATTRLQQFFTGLDKSYEGEIRLGFATTTYDSEGEPRDPRGDASRLEPATVTEAAARFLGESDQSPPPYSAKKVDGKRFYEIARAGGEVPVVSKRIRVGRFEVGPLEGDRLPFRLDCSTGTYVRSIAHELGLALGVGGHVSVLRRTAVGTFRLADALPLDAWMTLPEESRWNAPHFLGLDAIPLPFPKLPVDARQQALIESGQSVLVRGVAPVAEGSLCALVDPAGRLLAVGEASSGETWVSVHPRIVLPFPAAPGSR